MIRVALLICCCWVLGAGCYRHENLKKGSISLPAKLDKSMYVGVFSTGQSVAHVSLNGRLGSMAVVSPSRSNTELKSFLASVQSISLEVRESGMSQIVAKDELKASELSFSNWHFPNASLVMCFDVASSLKERTDYTFTFTVHPQSQQIEQAIGALFVYWWPNAEDDEIETNTWDPFSTQ